MNVLYSEVDAESKNVIGMIQLYTIHEILSKMYIIASFGEHHCRAKINANINVYCPEWYNWTPGWKQKKFLPFSHGRDLAAFNGTGLQNKSFQDWAEINKA